MTIRFLDSKRRISHFGRRILCFNRSIVRAGISLFLHEITSISRCVRRQGRSQNRTMALAAPSPIDADENGEGRLVTNSTSQYLFCALGHWSSRPLHLCWPFFILAYLAIIIVTPAYSNFQVRIRSSVTPPGTSSASPFVLTPEQQTKLFRNFKEDSTFTFFTVKVFGILKTTYAQYLPRKLKYMSSTRLRKVVHVYVCGSPQCRPG